METFVGRAQELAALERQLSAPGGAFVPVYGRRRIGKSELLRHFCARHGGLFCVGKVAPAALQLKEFLQEAARVLDEPLLAEVEPDTWKRALELTVGRWKGPGKLVLVLDEFQWMVEGSRELPSVLQELWDAAWKKSGKVMLVLCGSYLGFMEREVLGEQSPLFGRRTAQIHLKPFSFPEARKFHPGASIEQQALTWFVTGGVAQYLAAFDAKASFRQNVERTLLDEFAPLFREPEFLLREELRDVAPFHAVLMAIATGAHTPRAIAQVSGVPERNLHYHLETLVSLGYVSRRYPLTGEKPRRTDVRFVLDDALLRFWFRFVFPHRSQVAQLEPHRAFERLVAPQLEAWAGGCFERLCREALLRLLAAEGVKAGVEVGAYWAKDVEIDVVAVREDGVTELGECKWGHVTAAELGRQLERKAQAYANPRNHTLRRHAFVRTWKGKAPAGVELHQLKDLG
ncbi:MAG: ATP-binding protein [Myxococcales bacterium]|nr:ATP-binding protein [Myxococcales bacterium]